MTALPLQSAEDSQDRKAILVIRREDICQSSVFQEAIKFR